MKTTFGILIFFGAIPFLCGQSFLDSYAAKIDSTVKKGLHESGRKPNSLSSDETFLRRIYLDVVGRIPTAQEIDAFRKYPQKNKRALLIDKLIDSEGFVSHSFNYWADVLRATSKLNKVNGSTYIEYIKAAIRTNKPYDKFVHEMLTAEGYAYEVGNGATGYLLRDAQMPLDNMANTMQVFLGTDMVCAQCHDHPYTRWTQVDFYKLAAFNSGVSMNNNRFVKTKQREKGEQGVRKEIKKDPELRKNSKVIFDILSGRVVHGGTGLIRLPHDYANSENDYKPFSLIKAAVPFGSAASIEFGNVDIPYKPSFDPSRKGKKIEPSPGEDIGTRKVLADWLVSKENPMFTKTIVNRLWARVMGAPLVGPLTNISKKSLGVNPQLTHGLVLLMKKLNYDLKAFLKILYRTKTYQRNVTEKELKADDKYYFEGPLLKRLSAEQLWDSLLSLSIDKPDAMLAGKEQVNSKNVLYSQIINLSPEELKDFLKKYSGEKNLRKTFSGDAMAMNDEVPSRNGKKKGKGGKKNRSETSLRSISFSRASEMSSPAKMDHFLRCFGQSSRTQIDAASTESSIPQALNLMNGIVEEALIHNKESVINKELEACKSDLERIKRAYQLILGRLPSIDEFTIFRKLLNEHKEEGRKDLIWALVNSHEFKFNR
jgi:hypothetical protein